MKILFAGGGTAGHINPALAMAREFKRRDGKAEILFIGTKTGLESRLVPESGFAIQFVEVSGFKRKLTFENVKILFRFFASVHHCKQIIRDFQPDVAIGTGGYVSGPAIYAAHALSVPTAIQEQNAIPGITTKFLSRYANLVFTSFDETKAYLKKPEKIRLCGNPVRADFFETSYEKARRELSIRPDTFFVLCIGGSLGAQRLNDVMADLSRRIAGDQKLRLTFATGGNYYDRVMAQVQAVPENVEIQRYIDNMAQLAAASDVLIARSGASTIGEIAVLRKPSILIPSPNVTNNHQYHNARALSEKGAAILIEEKDLTAYRLYDTLQDLRHHPEKRKKIQENLTEFSHNAAAEEIVSEVYKLL